VTPSTRARTRGVRRSQLPGCPTRRTTMTCTTCGAIVDTMNPTCQLCGTPVPRATPRLRDRPRPLRHPRRLRRALPAHRPPLLVHHRPRHRDRASRASAGAAAGTGLTLAAAGGPTPPPPNQGGAGMGSTSAPPLGSEFRAAGMGDRGPPRWPGHRSVDGSGLRLRRSAPGVALQAGGAPVPDHHAKEALNFQLTVLLVSSCPWRWRSRH
jgi:hypothetical protein